MESDAFVSVCDGSSGQPQVFIVDLKNGNQVMKRPMSAEAAIMNPVSKILAERANYKYSTSSCRAKMKSHQMPETVVFWRWVLAVHHRSGHTDRGLPLVDRGLVRTLKVFLTAMRNSARARK